MEKCDDIVRALGAMRRPLPALVLLAAMAVAVSDAGAQAVKDQPKQEAASASASASIQTPAQASVAASKPEAKSDSKQATKADAKPAAKAPARRTATAAETAAATARLGGQYDRLLSAEDFVKYRNPEAVHKVQAELHIIWRDNPDFQRDVALGYRPLNDDIMGPVTLFWMQRYSNTFKVEPVGNFADGLIDSIASFAAFAEAQRSDADVILTPDFGKWLDARPGDKRQAGYASLRAGPDAERIALVDEYLKRTAKQPVERSPNQVYSYRIDDADIDLLRAKPTALQDLAAFPGKPFVDAGEFDTAILAALKGVSPDTAKRLLPDIEGAAKIGGYRITDLSIQRMQDTGVPDKLVNALDPPKGDSLKGVLFATLTDLDAAMQSTAHTANLDDEYLKNHGKLVSAAEIGTYSLEADALQRLSGKFSGDRKTPVVPLPLIGILTQLTGVNYPTSELFDKAAIAKIWYSLGTCPDNTPSYAKYELSLALNDDNFDALEAAVVDSVSHGEAKAKADMSKRFETIRPLRKQVGVCTDEQDGQAHALAADIYQFYRVTIGELVRKAPPLRDKPVLWSGGAWGFKDGAVTPSCGCVLDDLSGQIYAFYPFWLMPPEPPKEAKGGDAAKTEKTDGKAENPPAVLDFNVASRVGFVGFTFDDKGKLKSAPNRYDVDYGFTGVAQSFRSKVDWVIRRDEWSGWNAMKDADQTAAFKVLTVEIVQFLDTHGGNGVTLFFDGYPSYDDLPKNNDNGVAEFDAFVKGLSEALHKTGKNYGLNIVLRQPRELRKDGDAGLTKAGDAEQTLDLQDNVEHATAKVNDYGHMLTLLNAINGDESRRVPSNGVFDSIYAFFKPQLNSQTRNHILLLIEEPTTDAKKRLRLEIEQSLHGEERHRLLSGVIPVIEFDGRNWEQLEDDIIYFKDNFDGVGFWPVNFHQASTAKLDDTAAAASHCDHGETVEQCLVHAYQGYNLNGREDSRAKKFVCQFHIWFRTMFVLQLLLFMVAYLVPLFTCYMRNWIDDNFKVLGVNFGLLLLLGGVLFAWDPDLSGTRAHVIIIAALLLAALFEFVRRRQEFIARTVKPSRSKSAMAERNRRAAHGEDEPEGKQAHPDAQRSRGRYTDALKAVIRLRTYLESGKPASAGLQRELKSDLGVLNSYLEIDEKEGINTRIKIMKAAQGVIAHANDAASPVSKQKMRRLAVLLWSYLNGNIDAEKQVLAHLEPFLEMFEQPANQLAAEDRQGFAQVLHDAQHAMGERDKLDAGRFQAMRAAIAAMRQNVDREHHATPAIVSTMQVVWNYVDHDEMLHGREQIEATKTFLTDLRHAEPITP